jgi:hypothetical protein
MKRAFVLVVLPVLAFGVPAFAQQATPEDFGVPPQQQQPAPSTTPAPSQSSQVTVVSGNTASPATPPAPTASGPSPDDQVKLGKIKPSFRGQLGYQYTHMFGVPINAGRLRLGVGLQNDDMGHYMTFSSMVGETETGRRAWDLRVGYEGELRLAGIVRLGAGLEIGYVFVRRASIDERQWALGIGAHVHGSVDALTWGFRDDHALYVDARIEGHIHFGNADLWGPTLSIGVRF